MANGVNIDMELMSVFRHIQHSERERSSLKQFFRSQLLNLFRVNSGISDKKKVS